MLEEAFPQDKQIGGSHYKFFRFNPTNLFQRNGLTFFQGNVVKYVCRYIEKDKIKDLEKIIHYCELEIKRLKDNE